MRAAGDHGTGAHGDGEHGGRAEVVEHRRVEKCFSAASPENKVSVWTREEIERVACLVHALD